MSEAVAMGADVLSVGVLRPAAAPVLRPAPEAVAQAEWPAYRLEQPPGTGLFPRARLRRLRRAQAMALSTVKLALERCELDLEQQDVGVSVGTAWAELGDEIAFLENMIRRGEIGARPAFFANSVHNALASKIAIEFGWRSENHTFTHDALSFESALWQGIKLLHDGRTPHAVVCGADALADFLELRGHLLGLLDADPSPLEPLASPGGRHGTIPGEGAAAFVLAPPGASGAPMARVSGVQARGPGRELSVDHQRAFVEHAVVSAGKALDQVGFVLVGANGDRGLDDRYRDVVEGLKRQLAPGAAVGVYRHRTGDFATAAALGLASAVQTVADRRVVPEIRCVSSTEPPADGLDHVLLYHLTSAGLHSAMVVSHGDAR